MRLVKCRYILSASEVLGFENLVSVSFFIRHRVHQGTWWYLKRGECGRSFTASYHNIAFFGVPSRFKLQAASLASKSLFCYGRQILRNLRSLICLLKYHFCLWAVREESGLFSHLQIFSFFYSSIVGKAMAPQSSTLAWKIPWTEELGRLQSMGSRRVRTTERLHFPLPWTGEGNGSPLHCSCLEIPRDRGAWGLPSMGSPTIGQDWSDLAAVAAAAAE